MTECPICKPYTNGRVEIKTADKDLVLFDRLSGIEVKIPKDSSYKYCLNCKWGWILPMLKFDEKKWTDTYKKANSIVLS